MKSSEALAGSLEDLADPAALHEAGRLHLPSISAPAGWRPHWEFATTVAHTVAWYRAVHEGASALDCCLADLKAFEDGPHA